MDLGKTLCQVFLEEKAAMNARQEANHEDNLLFQHLEDQSHECDMEVVRMSRRGSLYRCACGREAVDTE